MALAFHRILRYFTRMTTTQPKYYVQFHDGTDLYTNDENFAQMTDRELAQRNIASIDRWSPAIDDFVQIRRTY